MLRVTTRFESALGGYPGYNNLYFVGSGTADALAVHTAVSQFWGDLGTLLANNVTFNVQAEVAEIETATGEVIGYSTLSENSAPGDLSDSLLPVATQGLIRIRTAGIRNNRRVQGRIFVPGFTEISSEGGRPTTAAVELMSATIDELISETVDNSLGVWSKPTPTQVGVFSVATGGDAWSEWAVLRSRRD